MNTNQISNIKIKSKKKLKKEIKPLIPKKLHFNKFLTNNLKIKNAKINSI